MSNPFSRATRARCAADDDSRLRNTHASPRRVRSRDGLRSAHPRDFRGCRVILTSHSWMLWSGTALAAAAMCYTVAAALAVRIRLKTAAHEPPEQYPAVTML